MKDRAKVAAIALAFLALFGFLVFQAGVASHYQQAKQPAILAQDHVQKNVLERFWEWTTHDAVAAYTLVLALSTIGLWIVTAKGVRNQAADTRILQRAYISVEPGGISPSSSGKKCHPNIVIKNAGNQPAGKVKWTIKRELDTDNRRSKLPVDEAAAEGNNVLPPRAEMTQGGEGITVGAGPLDIRKETGLYLYVWGAVFYEDGFGENRVTRFCHRYYCRNLEDITTTSQKDGRMIDKRFARFGRFGNDAT